MNAFSLKGSSFMLALLALTGCNPGNGTESQSQAQLNTGLNAKDVNQNNNFQACQGKFRSYWDRCLYTMHQKDTVGAASYPGFNSNSDTANKATNGCVALPPDVSNKLLKASSNSNSDSGSQGTKSIVPSSQLSSFGKANINLMKDIFEHWHKNHSVDAQAAGNLGKQTPCNQFLEVRSGLTSYIWELGDSVKVKGGGDQSAPPPP
jgi:hypothetical protein